MKKRKDEYLQISHELSLLSDEELSHFLKTAKPLNQSFGGETSLLKSGETTIFIKRIRLTDIERYPENEMSTRNFFGLPLYYQYGVGSKGFGAWRELQAHMITTHCVITDACQNFPILYHWRILPRTVLPLTSEQMNNLEEDVIYWQNASPIRDRLKANLEASADIVLFLEYFPYTAYEWLHLQLGQSTRHIENACQMIEDDLLSTIAFMQSHRFLHFDAHLQNIITDGKHLYFTDFGLAIASQFDLSEEEKNFFNIHSQYDYYSAFISFLHALMTYYDKHEPWVLALDNHAIFLPNSVTMLAKRYSAIARLMDQFYRELQKDKRISYPAKELDRVWGSHE